MAVLTERCPVCGFAPTTVSPSDAAVALRSYPRRYRGLLVRPDEDEPDVVTRRPAPDEWSALEHAAHAGDVVQATAAALGEVMVRDEPDVSVEAGAPSPRSLDSELERLAAACTALATSVERIRGEEWQRQGRVDGRAVRAVDLARHAVHAGVHHLRAAERTLSAVR